MHYVVDAALTVNKTLSDTGAGAGPFVVTDALLTALPRAAPRAAANAARTAALRGAAPQLRAHHTRDRRGVGGRRRVGVRGGGGARARALHGAGRPRDPQRGARGKCGLRRSGTFSLPHTRAT